MLGLFGLASVVDFGAMLLKTVALSDLPGMVRDAAEAKELKARLDRGEVVLLTPVWCLETPGGKGAPPELRFFEVEAGLKAYLRARNQVAQAERVPPALKGSLDPETLEALTQMEEERLQAELAQAERYVLPQGLLRFRPHVHRDECIREGRYYRSPV